MFQRKSMKDGAQQYTPEEWTKRVRELSVQWRVMPESERNLYKATALEEDFLRTEACKQPLTPKPRTKPSEVAAGAGDVVGQLSAKALKTCSRHRCLESYREYKLAPEWKDFDAGMCDADGALSLDAIDMDSTDVQVEELWSSFARAKAEPTPSEVNDANASIHHSTCWARHGMCETARANNGPIPVAKLVASLAYHLENGTLPCLELERSV